MSELFSTIRLLSSAEIDFDRWLPLQHPYQRCMLSVSKLLCRVVHQIHLECVRIVSTGAAVFFGCCLLAQPAAMSGQRLLLTLLTSTQCCRKFELSTHLSNELIGNQQHGGLQVLALPVQVRAYYLRTLADWLMHAVIKSPSPKANNSSTLPTPRDSPRCWSLLARLLTEGAPWLRDWAASPAIVYSAATACQGKL